MTYQLLNIGLVLHLTGIAMMAGTTVVDTLTWHNLWKQYGVEPQRALPLLQVIRNYTKLFSIGAALLIISGIMMVTALQGTVASQSWFHIKMVVVLLLILNGILLGRPVPGKLSKLLSGEKPADLSRKVSLVRKRIRMFHLLQLLLFATIFILSVYRFN